MSKLRVAYADPPYIGMAEKHYRHDPKCAEVDHGELVARLLTEYPDGWALSGSSNTLEQLMDCCRANGLAQQGADERKRYRLGVWVKPFASFKPGVNPAYAWEPVIFYGGRKRTRDQETVRDFVSTNITLRKGLAGAKPVEFCFWLFDFLNLQPGDTLDDLYPGTGIVAQAWNLFCSPESVPHPSTADRACGSLFHAPGELAEAS